MALTREDPVDAAARGVVAGLGLADPVQKARLDRLVAETGRKVRSRNAKFGRWKYTVYGLSGLGAVLAAVAGAAGLGGLVPASWPLAGKLPGLLALAAAVVTAIGTGLDPGKRLLAIGTERGPWGELRNDVLAFVSEAGRWGESVQDERRGWFALHLDDLGRRFADLERANAAARG